MESVWEIFSFAGGIMLISGIDSHSHVTVAIGFLLFTLSMGMLEESDKQTFETH